MASGTESNDADCAELQALRVLVVEDRGLIADRIALILREAGGVVIGPAATLGAGLDLARHEADRIGAALLDIDLQGETVYPLAELLQARGAPFLFMTGYGEMAILPGWRGAPRLEKPFGAVALLDALGDLVGGRLPDRPPGIHLAGRLPPSVRSAWNAIRSSRDLVMEGRIVVERNKLGKG